jgi:hypothetical protein
MRVDWKSLKSFLDKTKLFSFTNYMELPDNYYVWVYYEGESFSVMLQRGSEDCADFTTNYLPLAILKNDLSEDGYKTSKTVFVGQARMMHCLFVQFTTSTGINNDTSGLIHTHLLDDNEQITTNPEDVVTTQVDFCASRTQNYGLHGGGIETMEDIDGEFIVEAILAPDIPAQYGGNLYFVRNKVLVTPRENVSKLAINVGEIPHEPYGFNYLRIHVKHPKGIQKKFQLEIQYYI